MNMYCLIYTRIVYSRNIPPRVYYVVLFMSKKNFFSRRNVFRSHHLCPALNYDPVTAKEVARLAVAINVRRSKVRACRKGRKRERERQRDEKERDKVEAGRN